MRCEKREREARHRAASHSLSPKKLGSLPAKWGCLHFLWGGSPSFLMADELCNFYSHASEQNSTQVWIEKSRGVFFFFGAGLTSLNRQPRGELSPSNCVSKRVTILSERQKCEHGQKLEEKKNKPQEGSSEHPTIKQEILKSEKEKEKKGISK